jgi:hypothetical protein
MPSLRDLGLAVRTPSDRKLLLALRGVGPESEAESVRFHGRRVTKVGPEVKDGLFRVAGRARNPKKLPLEGWGPLNKGCERRTRTLPDVSAGGERHDRFGVVVGEGVVEPRIEGRFARRVGAGMHAHPLLPEPEMVSDSKLNATESPKLFATEKKSPDIIVLLLE